MFWETGLRAMREFCLKKKKKKKASYIKSNSFLVRPGCGETERQHPGWVWSQERGPGIQKSWPRSSKCNFLSTLTERKWDTPSSPPSPASLWAGPMCLCVLQSSSQRLGLIKWSMERGLSHRATLSSYWGGKTASWEDYRDIQACQLEVSPQLSGRKSCQYYFTL